MDLHFPVVFNEAEIPEFVHEKANPRTGRPDHLRERLLTDFCGYRLRLSFLAEIRQQEKNAGNALFAGIEQLVHKVRFDPDVAGQQVRREHLGKSELSVEDADHLRFLDAQDGHVGHRSRRRQAQRLPNQAGFAEKIHLAEQSDDCLPPLP